MKTNRKPGRSKEDRDKLDSIIDTAPSGTQTVDIAGLLLDEKVNEDIAKLKALYLRQRNKSAPPGPAYS